MREALGIAPGAASAASAPVRSSMKAWYSCSAAHQLLREPAERELAATRAMRGLLVRNRTLQLADALAQFGLPPAIADGQCRRRPAAQLLGVAARTQALGRREGVRGCALLQLQPDELGVDLVLVLHVAGAEALLLQPVANAFDHCDRRRQRLDRRL